MNILEILWKLGYDVHSFKDDVYEINFSKERIRRLRRGVEAGECSVDIDMDEHYYVKVGEVGFNGLGDLFVEFRSIINNSLIDFYEHNNMSPDELYSR